MREGLAAQIKQKGTTQGNHMQALCGCTVEGLHIRGRTEMEKRVTRRDRHLSSIQKLMKIKPKKKPELRKRGMQVSEVQILELSQSLMAVLPSNAVPQPPFLNGHTVESYLACV